MRRLLWISAALVAATVLAYLPVRTCGFVNLDDDAYVEFAPMVNQGVRAASVVWAFTSLHTANWHPLTSISHMVDCDLFGLRPGPMHWENVLWHVANALLVFAIWRRLTGAVWASALVAALFALHPLHVESVAWISERKDVLSTLWWLLGILAYLRWCERPSLARYALIVGCLAVALLFKPMAVTFPFTLLLLDYWPLRRYTPNPGAGPPPSRPQRTPQRSRTWRALVIEKLPLFALVVAHAAITFIVQHTAGAADYGARFGLGARVGNAFVSFARYLGKTLWPETLSPLYQHPGHWPTLVVIAAALLFVVLTVATWMQRRTRPWLAFGWCWYVVTLLPVIGFIQVGAQAMADRYSYVPLLGVFTSVVWLGREWFGRTGTLRRIVVAAVAALLIGCGLLTYHQVGVWRDSETLYRHSIAAGEDNAAIRYLLGAALEQAGRPDTEVAAQLQRALEIQPDYVNARTRLALVAARKHELQRARQLIDETLRYEPNNASLHVNLAMALLWENRTADAKAQLERAIQLNPREAQARRELAQLYVKENNWAAARAEYEAILAAYPWNEQALTELGILTANLGDFAQSARLLSRAVWVDPTNEAGRKNLAIVTDRLAGAH